MRNNKIKLHWFWIFVLILNTTFGYAQLSDFNLEVTATPETCIGNGALNMSVSNTEPGATILYQLFLLPDLDNPISETTANSFINLLSGDYRVVAIQILNGEENSEFVDITIEDLTTELDFDISHESVANCDLTSTIIVNIIEGNAVSYEIISGPVTVPPQESNEFNNVPQGTYIIRVFDECGNAVSKSYTMFLSANDIQVFPTQTPDILDSCDTITITNFIGSPSGAPLSYPLVITYTITPPNGGPAQTIIVNVPSESPEGFDITQNIPLFGNDIFDISISVTDACDNTFETSNTIDPNPFVEIVATPANCGQVFSVNVRRFNPPFTLNFTESPADFNPSDFNSDYPGPYSSSPINFGLPTTEVPTGNYTVSVTDSCGRTSEASLEITDPDIEPVVDAGNNGCESNFGYANITIPDRIIEYAEITIAPSNYPNSLPDEVTNFVTNSFLNLTDLPVGAYTIFLIDDCGDEYTIDFNVPEFVFKDLRIFTTENCLTETGSLRIDSDNGDITSVVITSAPGEYENSLPDDVSENIRNQGFYFQNYLPIGNYTINLTDECGFNYTVNVDIFDYNPTPFAYSINRNCGSFDLTIDDSDDSVTAITYWFQKFYPSSNSWGHPFTGSLYTEGETPNSSNSIEMQNMETLFNIFETGEFRVIKVFLAYNSNTTEYCLDIMAPFEVTSQLVISGIYNLNCDGGTGPSDIILDVIGVEPYNFSITSPFFLDNGSNNVFTGLPFGTYEIRVEDSCGSIETATVNLENLLPLVRVNTPDSMLSCRDDGIETDAFNLTNQNSQILGNQDPNDYTITYHISPQDANTGDNPLPEPYTNVSNPQTIYARVVHNSLNVCFGSTSFQIFIGTSPELSDDETVFICKNDTLVLSADPGYTQYEWSTAETTSSIVVNQPGTYSVTVSNEYDNLTCSSIQTFTVISSDVATINNIEIEDWTYNDNSITVSASGIGDYVYSIDGINYQDSNAFFNLEPGEYTVYVMDLNGCGIISETVFILNYPKFFTPNNDGDNDVWRIQYSDFEPCILINIFDRYGKFITNLDYNDYGWDGTLNGFPMPTNDYWFTVTRANGIIYKGHFTLKR
ncbi:T9SS type B sorting domain-containing protein [Hanstruepera marina]|uniref:T9SS type B sorting domain-containing protein n=1 Tax=Hanstruepera marina TaxID=2873265 RepID=UPI001CA68F6B|nr:T9SS type B sorting domain-containing protein [Hanstruepera marina]